MNLYRYLDLISFNADDAALVISISCSTRPADDLVSVGFHTSGKGINSFFAANTKSHMNKSCPGLSWSSKIVTLVSHKLTMRISPETA